MVDRKDPLPVVRQCQLLTVLRSTFYYQRQGLAGDDLALMRLIDECHLKHLYYGSRRVRDWLDDGAGGSTASGCSA
jgi:putative transposase